MQTEVYDLLYHLGVTANYTGFFQTASAVQLCMEQPERLLLVTKWVYPDVARQYKTNWKAVERNIRTVNRLVWEQNVLTWRNWQDGSCCISPATHSYWRFCHTACCHSVPALWRCMDWVRR